MLVRKKALDKNVAPVVEYSYTLGAAGEGLKVVETGKTALYENDELYRLAKETVTEYAYDANTLIR